MSRNYVVNHEKLLNFCTCLLSKYGLAMEDAKLVAEQLVSADMRGVRSHGVVRVELYLDKIKYGAIKPKAQPFVIKETASAAVIDGNSAAGAVVSEIAVNLARKKASEHGTGVVTVRRSNHYGAAGYWSLKLAGDDMVGFSATNMHPILAAPASKSVAIGNNPFSIAVPAGKYPSMCLDIANGVMALGKIHEYRRLNKPFPEGCWLDESGNPTTDPFANDFLKFISLPFGMHKGFGIAVMVEAITSMLSGGPVAAELIPEGYNLDKDNPVSHIFMAMKIDSFCEVEEYKSKVENFIDYLHKVPTRKDDDRVYYPGEIEGISYEKALREGIIIPEEVKSFLTKAADNVNLNMDPCIFVPQN